jgi:hypothetical protein
MDHTAPKTSHSPMILPLTVVSLIDLGRLQRELQAVELFLTQAAARAPGKALFLPRTTHNLDAVAQANKLNLLVEADRQKLNVFLGSVRDKAPHIHISFSADPSAAFLQKIVSWFRTSIHPLVILQVGLQPTIAAGCVLRTNSKYFDLSLRRYFESKRTMLVDKIRETRTEPVQPTHDKPNSQGIAGGGEKEYSFVKPVISQPAAPVQEVSGG